MVLNPSLDIAKLAQIYLHRLLLVRLLMLRAPSLRRLQLLDQVVIDRLFREMFNVLFRQLIEKYLLTDMPLYAQVSQGIDLCGLTLVLAFEIICRLL